MFRKIERVWSHNDMNYIPRFREVFPELDKVSSEDMCDRWMELGISFYSDEKIVPVRAWMRLTLPFALTLMGLMLIGIPFVFILTGRWGYRLGKKNRILNWFKSLRLLS
jgi:hypothetical protein